MNRCLLLFACAVASGCGNQLSTTQAINPAAATRASEHAKPPARHREADDFFVRWLEGHGHSDVVTDATGIGVGDNATRLRASLYGSKQSKNGFVVELEFTIRLPSQREITEFVAGMGDTEEQAVNDALLNFMLTTFHPVYKAFINDADPHMKLTTVAMGGADRDVIVGDIMMRGAAPTKQIDLHAMRAEIQGVLQKVSLTPEPHWIKVVYSQNDGKPTTVAVTLDNADHEEMTNAVRRLNWPRIDGFYMAKQFLVVK